MKRIDEIISLVLVTALLIAIVSAIMAANVYANSEVHILSSENRIFPDIKKSYLKKVKQYEFSSISHLKVGMNKDQIRQLLGNPHFSEGIMFVKVWNYVLDIRVPNTQRLNRCQLRIDFNKKYIAEKLSWIGQDCLNVLEPDPIPTKVDRPVVSTENFNINADVLFNFNGYKLNDLLVQGKSELAQFTTNMKNSYTQLHSVNLVGHTDRIGSDQYNNTLGLKRAQTIQHYLVDRGIPAEIIQFSSLGKNMPLTNGCKFVKGKKALRNCLQPDRRVTMEVTGIKATN